MTPETAFALFTTIALMVVIPGPGVMGVVSHSVSYGFRPTLRMITGMLLGDLLYLSLAVFGLSVMAHYLGGLFLAIRIAGGAYLIWLGVRLWMKKHQDDRPKEITPVSSPWKSYVSGLFITLGNPKVMLFYVGFLPNFIDLKALKIQEVAMAMLIIATVVFSILCIYAWSAARAGRLFRNGRARRIMDRISGTVLIGAGVTVAVKH